MREARWHQAYDAQIDLYKFWMSRMGRLYAEGFTESIKNNSELYSGVDPLVADEYTAWRAEQSITNFQGLLAQMGQGDPARGVVQIEASKMALADPIYVSPDMMDLVEAAAQTFVPEPLLPTDLIRPSGFVLFPRPMSFTDLHLKRASFRAISWMPAQTQTDDGEILSQGVSLSLYSHKEDALDPEVDDYADEYADLANVLPTWGLLHMTGWMFNEQVPKMFTERQGWWRDVQCLMRLSMQYISTRERMFPDRAVRKRAARAGVEDKYVTVITLRRPRAKKDGEPSSVDWHSRWVVGGHWRNQWYPSLDAHRQIWIAPYIKGPEGKELKLRKIRAFELVR